MFIEKALLRRGFFYNTALIIDRFNHFVYNNPHFLNFYTMKFENLALIGALSIGSAAPALTGCDKKDELYSGADKTCEQMNGDFNSALKKATVEWNTERCGILLQDYVQLRNIGHEIRVKCSEKLDISGYETAIQGAEKTLADHGCLPKNTAATAPVSAASVTPTPAASSEKHE